MEIQLFILMVILLTLIYNLGQLFFMIKSGMHDQHYFLGFNPRLVDFKGGVKFSLGLFIPIFPFARIYKIEDGKKQSASMVWEFTQFALWKRWLITFAGTFTLLIAGTIIYIFVSYFEKEEFISKEEVNRLGIYPSALAKKAGFEKGDKILSINGKNYEKYNDLLLPETGTTYQISRGGKNLEIKIPKEIIDSFYTSYHDFFLLLNAPFEVEVVLPNSAAAKIGLKRGDRITKVNDKSVFKINELKEELKAYANKEVQIAIERKVDTGIVYLNERVNVNQEGTIGFAVNEKINYSTTDHSILDAIGIGLKRSWNVIPYNVGHMTHLNDDNRTFRTTSSTEIKSLYSDKMMWKVFWVLCAQYMIFFSVLTVMPLPNACLWEVIPLVYEGFTRKKMHVNAYKILRWCGYIILALLIIVSIFMDVNRHLNN